MKYFDKKNLEKLIISKREDSPTTKICYNFFSEEGLKNYSEGGKVSINEAVEIYQRRIEINKDKNNKIEGFDILLPSLHSCEYTHIKIHSFGDGEKTFVLFTDVSVKNLIGCLIIPKGIDSGLR